MYHSQIWLCMKWTYNVHIYITSQILRLRSFIKKINSQIKKPHLEIQKTRNDFSVQVRNFLLPLSLKVLRHKEREAQSFYSGFFICNPPPPILCDTCPRPPRASESQPSSSKAGLNSTNWLFQNLPKSSTHFRCVTSFALASPVSHLGLLWHL